MRPLVLFVSMILLCGLASPAVSGGTIDIQTTPSNNLVVIDITVVDNGGSGGCNGSFTLKRRTLPECRTVDIATFARQPGTTSTQRFFDGPLQQSRAYAYEVVACSGFTCGGWGLGDHVVTATATTPVPAFLGQGRLQGNLYFVGCPGLCCDAPFYDLPPNGWQYVDTSTEVLLYGDFVTDCQWGWRYRVSQVVPQSCTVSVDARTWSGTKRLFR